MNQPTKHRIPTNPQQQVIVIGGGLAGMTAAAELGNAGYEVILCEKRAVLGGKVDEKIVTVPSESGAATHRFRFDAGPSLFTMSWVFEELFRSLGSSLKEELALVPLEPICRYFFASGHQLNTSTSIDHMASEFEKLAHGEGAALRRFLQFSKELYNATESIYLRNPISWRSPFRLPLRYLPLLPRLGMSTTLSDKLTSYFSSSEARQLFGRYATYSGSSPYKAPATLCVIPHVEYGLGAFYVEGGIRKIVDALAAHLKRQNIQVLLNSPVKKILTVGGSAFSKPKAVGIMLDDGTTICGDAVVVNSDVTWSRKNLLPHKRMREPDPSTSAVVFLWCMKGTTPELLHHNIFFAEDYKKEFDQLATEFIFPEQPTVYVNITSKSDTSDAPLDCENWFVMVNAPALFSGNAATSIKPLKDAVIGMLERHTILGIQNRILHEEVLTPAYFENTFNAFRGTLYGASSNTQGQAFFRKAANGGPVKGVFFCGGSCHPGGGMPLVIQSGRFAADAVKGFLR